MFASPPVAQAPRSRLRRANIPAWTLQVQRYIKDIKYATYIAYKNQKAVSDLVYQKQPFNGRGDIESYFLSIMTMPTGRVMSLPTSWS